MEDDGLIDQNSPAQTGLFIVDIEKNQRELIVKLSEIVHILPDKTMVNARHYFTHTHFSPDGTYVAFLHRWIHGDVRKRYSRLITCEVNGSDIHVSPTSGMVSLALCLGIVFMEF